MFYFDFSRIPRAMVNMAFPFIKYIPRDALEKRKMLCALMLVTAGLLGIIVGVGLDTLVINIWQATILEKSLALLFLSAICLFLGGYFSKKSNKKTPEYWVKWFKGEIAWYK